MSLDADRILDRQRFQSQISRWRLATFVSLFLITGLLLADRSEKLGNRDRIALVEIEGIILNDQSRILALEEAKRDPSVRALIVKINSPGGTVVGGEALYRAIRFVSESKPVVALIGDMATSAGYMAAIAANRIYAHRGSVTGSIGVLFQTAEFTALLDRLGIRVEAIKSNALKGLPSPFEKISPDARATTRAVIDNIQKMFIELVAERRGFSLEQARRVSDGRIYSGEMALRNGLIDEIGSSREALNWLRKDKMLPKDLDIVPIQNTSRLHKWFDSMVSLAQNFLRSETLSLDGIISIWQPLYR
jgi:protease-4